MSDKARAVASHVGVALRPAPIVPAWIKGGKPKASNAVVAVSDDGLASIVVWQCMPGKFIWHYDSDETIHFLRGEAFISCQGMARRRFGKGDILHFKKGAVAQWHITKTVRKLAVFRRPLPQALARLMPAAKRVVRAIRGHKAPTPSGTMA